MTPPELPLPRLVTLMDRTGLKSRELRQRWCDAFHYFFYDRHCYHGGEHLVDALYLRVLAVCIPAGRERESLLFAAEELAAQYSQKR